jgi:aspartate racemase
MKTVGIVGGIGPESTIDYYRLLIAAGHTRIIIVSVAVENMLGMMMKNDTSGVADYLSAAVEQLANAGADVAIIAANTPHIVFDDVQQRARVPMVSIIEAAAAHVADRGMRRVGLLGTGFTMQGRFYPDVFARRGLSVVAPAGDDFDYVHAKYIGEFLKNQFLPETRAGILAVIDRLKRDQSVEAVILGGTELPILLRSDAHNGLPLLDTTKMHVDAVLAAVQVSSS